MTTPSRTLRLLVAILAVAVVAVPAARTALANGLGDLYVAVPEGVAEVRLVDERIEATVDAGAATGLAFTNDGAYLFVVDDAGALSRIDIETISLDKTYTLPAAALAVAHPEGDALLLALEGQRALGVLADGSDDPTTGPELRGMPDLIAADRLDHRAVAARYGEPWVDIVETPSGSVESATLDGEVVALAVADDTGYAYAATTGPNRLWRVALDTGSVDWGGKLDGKPSAVTAVDDAAIVAVGADLVRVTGEDVVPWSETDDDVTALATSDEGQFVYLATADAVLAIDKDHPTAEPRATVALDEPTALAPVHKASTLVANGGQTIDPEDGSAGSANGTHPQSTKAPATDTEDGPGPLWRRAGPDPVVLFGGGGAIVLLVLLASRELIKRSVGEG
jgi:hypothetical protein